MSGQRFYADPRTAFTWPNGAIGYRTGTSNDCLGPYAKVVNCPVSCTFLRRTCYATAYADTAFSIPAVCKIGGQMIRGYFSFDDNGIEFRPLNSGRQFIAEHEKAYYAAQVVEQGVDKSGSPVLRTGCSYSSWVWGGW
jgi:hypothetical protein